MATAHAKYVSFSNFRGSPLMVCGQVRWAYIGGVGFCGYWYESFTHDRLVL